jgi:hypothetical protein
VRPLHFRAPGVAATRIVATALALFIALQGIGATFLATLGPLHTHKASATFVVLDDFRRGPSHVGASERAAERHGHSHGLGAAQRHPHATGDTSVNLAPGEAVQALDADDAGFGATLAALVALVPAVPGWQPQAPRDVLAPGLAWVPQNHPPDPFERPPRSV